MLDVAIVGAGLAGLNCARILSRQGYSVKLFEKSDRPGGRVRTDEVDGFRLDRGFQVMLTAYPEAQQALDYDALDLHRFYDGAQVFTGDGFHRVSDPMRNPLDAPGMLFSPIGSLKDKMQVATLRRKVTEPTLDALLAHEEIPTIDALKRRWGFSDLIIDQFFRPFLGGILLEDGLKSSSRMFEFVFRMFAQGHAALPAGGMEALPRQLAAGLPEGAIVCHAAVTRVRPGAIDLEDGRTIEAASVVAATDAPEAAALVPAIPPGGFTSVTCLYFGADTPPFTEPTLVLNGVREGPVNNLAVPSNVAPGYAPEGRALISVTVLGNPLRSDDDLLADVRAQLESWYGEAVAGWTHLRTYRILYALPDQTPPFLSPPERPVRLSAGLYACGDFLDTASINGALAAGRRAAEAVMTDCPR